MGTSVSPCQSTGTSRWGLRLAWSSHRAGSWLWSLRVRVGSYERRQPPRRRGLHTSTSQLNLGIFYGKQRLVSAACNKIDGDLITRGEPDTILLKEETG